MSLLIVSILKFAIPETAVDPVPRDHALKLPRDISHMRPVTGLSGLTLMSIRREIRCYDYVNHPYEHVRDALRQGALAVFQSATKAAAYRAQSIAAELHVDVAGIGVKSDFRQKHRGESA